MIIRGRRRKRRKKIPVLAELRARRGDGEGESERETWPVYLATAKANRKGNKKSPKVEEKNLSFFSASRRKKWEVC